MSEFRDAYRALRSTPTVAAVAILSLTLAIGANVTLFSLTNSLLLKPLPVPAPEELAAVSPNVNDPAWKQIRGRRLIDAFAWRTGGVNLAEGGPVDMVEALFASGSCFDVLRVPPVVGRTFSVTDDRPDGGPDGPVAGDRTGPTDDGSERARRRRGAREPDPEPGGRHAPRRSGRLAHVLAAGGSRQR